MNKTSCAITGHRPKSFPWKYNETDPGCVLLKEVLAGQILELVNRGVTDWFSGMALGVDVWSSEIILYLRKKNSDLRLHCILPCEGQESKWTTPEQERYHSILEQADSVDYVSRKYYDGCMIDRNHRLVEAAGCLLAIYNGVRRSGTGATVRYARKLGRQVFIIDPITRAISRDCQGV